MSAVFILRDKPNVYTLLDKEFYKIYYFTAVMRSPLRKSTVTIQFENTVPIYIVLYGKPYAPQ